MYMCVDVTVCVSLYVCVCWLYVRDSAYIYECALSSASYVQVLESRQADERAEAFEKALHMGKLFIRDTKSALLRINLHKLGVSVRGVPHGMESWEAPAAFGGDVQDDVMSD